jgi:hypothetical protein
MHSRKCILLSICASTMVWKSCTDRNRVSIVNKDGLIASVRVVEHRPANASLKIRFHESCGESVIGRNAPSHLKVCICWMSANMFLQCCARRQRSRRADLAAAQSDAQARALLRRPFPQSTFRNAWNKSSVAFAKTAM